VTAVTLAAVRREGQPRTLGADHPGARHDCAAGRGVEGDVHPPWRVGQRAQLRDRAVVDEPAVAHQRDALGEPGDLGHVVRGEQHGPAAAVHLVPQELPHLFLDHHVHPDRRLVEEDDLRVVDQRGGQVAPDSLPERQLAGPGVPELGQLKDRAELGEPGPVVSVADPVDVAEDRQGLPGRQVPPQLGTLAEDGADAAGVRDPVAVRHDPVDLDPAGSRRQDPGEHLDGGRLACPVRAE
jgi:hypothetical protein